MNQIPSKETVSREIEHFLAQNKVLDAIERLRDLPEHRREAILLSKRWHDIQKRERQQLLSSEDVIVEQNKLATAILELLEQSAVEQPDIVSERAATVHVNQPPSSPSTEEHQVFICYAREDLALAQQVYDDLERAGVSPWIDKEELLAGQKWELIIKQAMKSSSYVLVLLSQTSISKRGFVQHEIKHAVKLSNEFPSSAIFILPVRLEECKPPEELKGLHWVDLFPDYQAGLTQLLKVLAPEGRDELLRRKIQMLTTELARLEQERRMTADSEQIRRLNVKISEVQVQQEQTETRLEVLDEQIAASPVFVMPKLPLRSKSMVVSAIEGLEEFKLKSSGRPFEYIRNNYEDWGDAVFDHATGLMWQKSGSGLLNYTDTQKYVKELNHQQFASYDGWRVPTIPELMSLLEPEKQPNGLYINPIFDETRWWCWSADIDSSGVGCHVRFHSGLVHLLSLEYTHYVRCVRTHQNAK